MRLDIRAVTVSVGYADYLRACLANRNYFNSWIVVSSADDSATARLAEAAGLHSVRTTVESFSHKGFHAAYRKSRFINKGLSAALSNPVRSADTESWCLIIDGDILLPDDFRERLDSLFPFLSSGDIYGVYGRRAAEAAPEFCSIRDCQPWLRSGGDEPCVLGSFQLFRLRKGTSYPDSDRNRIRHDDIRFYEKFGPRRAKNLPFVILHCGQMKDNWDELIPDLRLSDAKTPAGNQAVLNQNLCTDCVMVLGFWLSKQVKSLASRVSQVFLLDTRSLTQRSEDVLEEADRIFCWNRFVEGIADCPNVFLVGTVDMTPLPVPNSDEVRVRLPMRTAPMPESVDHIHFGHEPAHEFIFEKLAPVLRKLKPGGWLSGTHYGLPGFPQTTSTIELLLGTPEIRDSAGGWALRQGEGPSRPLGAQPLTQFSRLRREGAETAPLLGVALFVYDAQDATRALTAVFSLRQQYDGGIAVLMWGKEVPALRIACARLGVEYVSIMDAAKARGDTLLQGSVSGEPAGFAREQARLLAMGYSPFAQTVMVSTDSAMPQLAKWWKAVGRVGVPPAGSGILPEPSERTTGTRARKGSLLDSTGCYAGRAARRAGRPPYPAHVVMDDGGNTAGFDRQNASFIRWHARVRKSLSGPIRKYLNPLEELAGAGRLRGGKTLPLLVSPEAETALILANPAHVWWPKSCTVVTAAMPEDLETLAANWRSMRWPAGMRRFLSTECTEDTETNTEEDALSRPFAPLADGAELLSAKDAKTREKIPCPSVCSVDPLLVPEKVTREFADQAYWIQAIIAAAARCKTKRLLYLDPCMRPVPGAELFYREADQSAAYASAGWCFVRRGKKVLKTPKLGPPATLFDVAFLKRAMKAFAGEKKERNFEVFLHAFAKKEKRTVTVQDVMPCGWNR